MPSCSRHRLPGGRLISIDIEDRSHSVRDELRSRWNFMRGDSREVLPDVNAPIEFALFDGEHTFEAVEFELEQLERLVIDGGIVVLDDCWDDYPGVLKAFAEFSCRRTSKKSLLRYGTDESLAGSKRTMGIIRFGD